VVIAQKDSMQPKQDLQVFELMDDDLILDATILLSSAGNHQCFAMTTDDNDVHTLNS